MLLTSANVGQYLLSNNLCPTSDIDRLTIKPIVAKNFNLLVTFPDESKLLVKQERHNKEGKTANEFQKEWQIKEFITKFSRSPDISFLLGDPIHFDSDNSIIIFRYLNDYRDLSEFYSKENNFDINIASSLGKAIATIHKSTFNSDRDREFFSSGDREISTNQVATIGQGLSRLTPEIFGLVPTDGLKFFSLYQRYDSLGQAIAELGNNFIPSCLTHNDLKLNNILIHKNWEETEESIIRLIDWERSGWGDPSFDLGTLIGSYVQIWLSSLVISSSLRIEESLKLATTPLEILQPTIANLTISYLKTFPELIQKRPDFVLRTVQNAGFILIMNIQATIQYQKSFGNMGIGMLQVAKSLLCRPERSIPTLFGTYSAKIAEFQNTTV